LSAKTTPTIKVRILEHEYQVACPDNERESLLAAAEYLNQRMQAIRKKGKALSVERIAVMTALNMAHELLGPRQPRAATRQTVDRDIGDRLQQMQLKIDQALNDTR
jgi:cell division protein ZapA